MKKAIRDEYLKSLGLDPQDKPDPETGKIIHECQEPLSEHRNHGSAKNKDDKKA